MILKILEIKIHTQILKILHKKYFNFKKKFFTDVIILHWGWLAHTNKSMLTSHYRASTEDQAGKTKISIHRCIT